MAALALVLSASSAAALQLGHAEPRPTGGDVVTLPLAEAQALRTAAGATADREVAAGVGLLNALGRNATSAVNTLARGLVPQREVGGVQAALTTFAQSSAGEATALEATAVALASQAVDARVAEATTLALTARAAVGSVANASQALAARLPGDVAAMAEALQDAVDSTAARLVPDTPWAQPLATQLAGGSQGLAEGFAVDAAARACGAPQPGEPCAPGSRVGRLQSFAVRDVPAVAEADRAAAVAAASGASRAGGRYTDAASAAALDAGADVAAGLGNDEVVVPFHQVDEVVNASSRAAVDLIEVGRVGGLAAIDSTAPVEREAGAARADVVATADSATVAALAVPVTVLGLSDAACSDPATETLLPCGDGTLGARLIATAEGAVQGIAVSGGASQARAARSADGQVAGTIGLANLALGQGLSGSDRTRAAAPSGSVVVPLAESQAVGEALLAYAAASEARAVALGPGLASDLSADPGGTATTAGVAVGAYAGHAGQVAFGLGSAALGVALTVLR